MMKKHKNFIYGVGIFLVLAIGGIFIFGGIFSPKAPQLATVVCATGGGKENFLADEEINLILEQEYGIKVEHISWSNGRISDQALADDAANSYDAVFFSDERFYEQYTQANNQVYKRQKGFIALKTPIVMYSWKEVADLLVSQGIVSKRGETYYVTGMEKLLSLIDDEVKWRDIANAGSPVYSNPNAINIASVDPEKSSPGATYYGLLAAIMDSTNQSGKITEQTIERLQKYYIKSGFMGTAPIDLFNKYLMMGMGAYPVIVDYEKSLIDWAISNPSEYNKVAGRIVVLYPEPTIWNSHCIISFNDKGTIFVDALEKNQRIQEIAFEKYGFRMGLVSANTDKFLTELGEIHIEGIPQEIYSVVQGLKMDGYNQIIEGLSNTR
ncbi:MAG: hypothetical protein FWG10_00545 [Eubacteriaceae bacterium]|nr:hypothetical protein [Eubacteriaceae bacterium]